MAIFADSTKMKRFFSEATAQELMEFRNKCFTALKQADASIKSLTNQLAMAMDNVSRAVIDRRITAARHARNEVSTLIRVATRELNAYNLTAAETASLVTLVAAKSKVNASQDDVWTNRAY